MDLSTNNIDSFQQPHVKATASTASVGTTGDPAPQFNLLISNVKDISTQMSLLNNDLCTQPTDQDVIQAQAQKILKEVPTEVDQMKNAAETLSTEFQANPNNAFFLAHPQLAAALKGGSQSELMAHINDFHTTMVQGLEILQDDTNQPFPYDPAILIFMGGAVNFMLNGSPDIPSSKDGSIINTENFLISLVL